MRKNSLTTLAAAALSLVFVSCKDTEMLQQNEQLKSQVAELQQENAQLGNQIETLTAERDELTQKNAALREKASRRTKRASKKRSSRKTRSHGHTVAEGPTPREPGFTCLTAWTRDRAGKRLNQAPTNSMKGFEVSAQLESCRMEWLRPQMGQPGVRCT